MKIKKRKIILFSGIIGIIYLGSFAYLSEIEKKPDVKTATPEYKVVKIKPTYINLSGRVRPVTTQSLILPTGKVNELLVNNGQIIEQGQEILRTFEDKSSEINDLKGQIDENTRNLQRLTKENNDSEAISEIEQLKQTITQQNINLQTLQSSQYHTLTAPLAGTINIIQNGQSSYDIAINSHDLEAIGSVSEYDYEDFKHFTDLEVTSLATNRGQRTKPTYLAPYPNHNRKKNYAEYEFTAPVDNQIFINGQSLKMVAHTNRIRIPIRAILNSSVYTYNNDQVKKVPVKGTTQNGQVTISEGLSVGDSLILNPTTELKHNMKIKTNDKTN